MKKKHAAELQSSNLSTKKAQSLNTAELELQEIKNNRAYCTQFYSLINPIMKEIKTTGHEVEVFVSDYLIT